METHLRLASFLVVLLAMTLLSPMTRAQRAKQNIAHRGASAYTPEHTMAAYRLALEQGADFVEQDLAVTRDGELICLHDDTLERTTIEQEQFTEYHQYFALFVAAAMVLVVLAFVLRGSVLRRLP